MFCTAWNNPNEYPPIKIQPKTLDIIVDLLLCLRNAFSIISLTSSLLMESEFGFLFIILFLIIREINMQ